MWEQKEGGIPLIKNHIDHSLDRIRGCHCDQNAGRSWNPEKDFLSCLPFQPLHTWKTSSWRLQRRKASADHAKIQCSVKSELDDYAELPCWNECHFNKALYTLFKLSDKKVTEAYSLKLSTVPCFVTWPGHCVFLNDSRKAYWTKLLNWNFPYVRSGYQSMGYWGRHHEKRRDLPLAM